MEINSFLTPLAIMMLSYSLTKTHIMNNLIMLEYLVMMIIISLFMMVKLMNIETHLVLYFIVLMITESVVGLSMMISMIRTHGNDFLKSTMIMKL
uniref:NADH dehydrogenase subunit 4l n=1 Tax=Bemisia afer TaxID=166114 RepID=A0A0U2GTL9_BEMAF|nr:NADH dehydrogenase subunit 4l [Bemisia afer]